MLLPPPKRCGVSFVIRDAREVVPYGYAAAYPPPPSKRCGVSFGKQATKPAAALAFPSGGRWQPKADG